ncbi:FAD-dependent oxidoreductase [soil metagenome]
MENDKADIIVIGAGSGGLSVGLFLAKVGLKIIMIVRSEDEIGGECLNDGCVPSKAFIHASHIIHSANRAKDFGLEVNGKASIKKVLEYVHSRQETIREHENAEWLSEQGVTLVTGVASFTGRHEVRVNETIYTAKKIIIATGSKPRKLKVKGIEKTNYYDNENIFHIATLPKQLLVVGAGPIGIEIAQSMSRLGSQVTVIDTQSRILMHDEESMTQILLDRLKKEGITFYFNVSLQEFTSSTEAVIKTKANENIKIWFDAVFSSIGRELILDPLKLENAGIKVSDNKIVIDKKLRTSNRDVMVCGDIAGDLQFSHAAEFHGRIILNNLFSPFSKKLNNDNMSWVTFSDPELAAFGLNEKQLKDRNIKYEKLENTFKDDDRAVTDNYTYSKSIMYVTQKGFLKKQKILGGTMIAPGAGELIQELILANSEGLSVNSIFNKIYPYPVASRINQQLVLNYKEKSITETLKKILRFTFKFFG